VRRRGRNDSGNGASYQSNQKRDKRPALAVKENDKGCRPPGQVTFKSTNQKKKNPRKGAAAGHWHPLHRERRMAFKREGKTQDDDVAKRRHEGGKKMDKTCGATSR